jgi:hypothetical protein
MKKKPSEKVPPPDFAVVFAQVNEAGDVESIQLARQIAEQAETIRLISEVTERPSQSFVVTYFSS